MPAQSYDSYVDTLYSILDIIQPKNVLEFGTGKSTKILATYQSVQSLTSYEHDMEYYQKIIGLNLANSKIIYEPDLDKYANSFDKLTYYDLIFIDGRNRVRCIQESKPYLSKNGVMLLHDADRDRYIAGVNEFPYKIWTDDGNTVTLMTSEIIHNRLVPILSSVKNTIGVKS